MSDRLPSGWSRDTLDLPAHGWYGGGWWGNPRGSETPMKRSHLAVLIFLVFINIVACVYIIKLSSEPEPCKMFVSNDKTVFRMVCD